MFKLHDLLPSPIDDRDFIAEEYIPLGSLKSNVKTLDYRPHLRPIKNQGKQGSCAAQTAACIKEYQEFCDIQLKQCLSPQFIYDNREDKKISGMYSRDVMRILFHIGICYEKTYPYGKPRKLTERVLSQAKNFLISHYARVYTQKGLKSSLSYHGPCLIAMPTYNSGSEFWKPQTPSDTMLGGHAVTIVGFNEEGYIIRNSWGTSWGNNGYSIYKYEDWGCHWEIWTVIDAKTKPHEIEDEIKEETEKRKKIENDSIPDINLEPLKHCCVIL